MKSRRLFMGLVALALVAMVLAAPSAGAAKAAPVDPAGVFRKPIDMTANGGVGFDPIFMAPAEWQHAYPVLAGYLKTDADGSYSLDLAEKVDVPDPQTIVITLRKGLTFSNGETLDATAAVNSIMRAKNNVSFALRTAEMNLLASATVDSPTQFTLRLSSPSVGAYYPMLDDAETAPIAPASIAANTRTSKTVIGAGPFKIDSYTTGVGVKMSKNDKYYDAKNIKLAGWELVNVATAPGNAVTALRSNTVDIATG